MAGKDTEVKMVLRLTGKLKCTSKPGTINYSGNNIGFIFIKQSCFKIIAYLKLYNLVQAVIRISASILNQPVILIVRQQNVDFYQTTLRYHHILNLHSRRR